MCNGRHKSYYICIVVASVATFLLLFIGGGWLLYLFGYQPGDEVATALDQFASTVLGAIGLLILAAVHTILKMLEFNNNETRKLKELIENNGGISAEKEDT